jgi:hypothetical protein
VESLDLGCRVAIAVVFGAASASKSYRRAAFEEFVESLPGFGFPPALARRPVGAVLVAAEATAAVLGLVLPSVGFPLALLLTGGFLLGIAHVLRQGEPVACRCFGGSSATIGPEHLVRNALLLAIAALGVLHTFGLVPPTPAQMEAQAVAAFVGLLLAGLIARWDDFMFIFRPSPLTPRPPSSRK